MITLFFWFVAAAMVSTANFSILKVTSAPTRTEEERESSWSRFNQFLDNTRNFITSLHTWVKLFVSSFVAIVIYQIIITALFR